MKPAAQHVQGLDGLRALSVLSVMAVHIGFPGMDQGGMGVDVFFVLSGFLITTLLLKERRATGGISLGAFWARRFLRLMPAFWLYIGPVTLAMLLGYGYLRPHGGYTPTNYITALWCYFVNFMPMGGIWEHQWYTLHLWSLAVEEQFYFVWPPLLALLLLRRERLPRAFLIAVPILATALGMLISRTYILGWLPLRAPSLVVGSAAALLCDGGPSERVRNWLSSSTAQAATCVWCLGVIAAATLAERDLHIEHNDVLRCTLPLFSPAMALLIVMIWYGRPGRLTRALSFAPLAYIGKISYGMYLYHMLAQRLAWEWLLADVPGVPAPVRYLLRALCFAALTLGIASASYYFFERRILTLKERFRCESAPRSVPESSSLA